MLKILLLTGISSVTYSGASLMASLETSRYENEEI